MKILVVCQHYAPEPVRLPEICEELVRRGHRVDVITGVPNYPMGYIYDGYKKGKKRDENINGVSVHRCFTIGRRKGIFFRFLNYYSFALSSSLYASRIKENYDAVFVNQLSPVMMACAGVRYKKKHKTRLFLYCLDLWPESLTVGGIKRGSLIYRIFKRISRRIYNAADEIAITSKSFADYFEKELGIPAEKVSYIPQFSETLFTPESCKKQETESVDLMFAGNIGVAQSVETIIKAASLTQDVPKLRWHIVGDGSDLSRMREMVQQGNLSNVIFHGRHPVTDMPRFYAMADAMLITMQTNPLISLTLPGKIQTYMAAGKPILGAIDGEANRIIADAKCGLCVPAEDAEGLAKIARQFVSASRKDDFAKNALQYYQSNFEKSTCISQMEHLLLKCTNVNAEPPSNH